METTSKASKAGSRFVAFLTASATLAIATFVSASSSHQVEQLDSLVVPRIGHAATALSDGRVLVAGGTGDIGPLSSAEIFDPANPDAGFRVLASMMSAARARHTATLLNNGRVLIAGGEATGTAEIFDPATELFSPTLWAMTTPRAGHTATLFSDDSVLLAGGNTDSMELFTASDQKFTLEAATMSASRTGHWALELSDTRLLFFEGDTGSKSTSSTLRPARSHAGTPWTRLHPAPRCWPTEKSWWSGPMQLGFIYRMLFLQPHLSPRSMKHRFPAAAYCRAMVRPPRNFQATRRSWSPAA